MGGVLFAKKYFIINDPNSSSAQRIEALADKIWNTTQFSELLCSSGPNSTVDPNGTAIPMIQVPVKLLSPLETRYLLLFVSLNQDGHSNECSALMQLEKDGMYHFNEEHYTVWYSFEQVRRILLPLFANASKSLPLDSVCRVVVQIPKENVLTMPCKICGITGKTVDFIQMSVDICRCMHATNEMARC